MKQNALPSFRQRGLSLSSLNVPRRYHLPLILLRTLSLIPSVLGIFYNTQSACNVPLRDSGGALLLQSTQSDYWTANIWCALAGYWSWILTTSMMRRWLYHYEISSAIVRLVTLTVINWSISAFVNSTLDPDQPIAVWMAICFILLSSNVIKLIFASSAKYHQKAEDVQSPRLNLKSTAFRVLVLPLSVVTCLTMCVTLYQMDQLQYTTTQLMHQPLSLNVDALPTSSIVVLILSSWSSQAYERRQLLRRTSHQWLLNSRITYRFVVGQPPSAHLQMVMGPKIKEESEMYHDMLLVPASDLNAHKSRKVYEALIWANGLDFDYLVKTEDNVFVRWDRVLSELAAENKTSYYWRGLVFRNMPPDALGGDKSILSDYQLPILPPYTSGTMYTISRDIVDLIVGIRVPQRFVAADDRNLGIWLFGFDIHPIQDARIQDGDVCEESQLAKRFGQSQLGDMVTMYENAVSNQPQCAGLVSQTCALCYPCYDKKDDWRSMNLDCDEFKGVTLHQQPTYIKSTRPKVRDDMIPSVIGQNDAWIIDGILSQRTSKYSDTPDWHLLYWVCWTSDQTTFTERHWRALELIWVHEPRAIVFMISNTLPHNFFDEYRNYGYSIYLVNFNKDNLLNWHWYFGPGTFDWLNDWEKWENGKFFYWHLTDYIRCLLLYNYGGTYMDMDALWIRVPPDSELEFIGSDYTSNEADLQWTLDDQGLYLPQGLMRFKRGWALFREMCESAFSSFSYDPECFNCHGPKAITSYVREHRAALEMNGFTILPREVLYPASFLEINRFLLPNPLAEHELKTKIMVNSWNIHLFGKMTNHLPIEKGSIIDAVLRQFDLDVPHTDAKSGAIVSSTRSQTVPMRLVGPRNYIYRFAPPFSMIPADANESRRRAIRQSAPGRFQGLDRIYVRGGPARVDKMTLSLEMAFGELRIASARQNYTETFREKTIELTNASQKDINGLLSNLVYFPSALLAANGGRDRMSVSVAYSTEQVVDGMVEWIGRNKKTLYSHVSK
ncbi:galactosyltransferase-domain-containing protein [Dichotomocladium elegans]|nr:galactosyltransferase-domain-containing protein [Dichotomocladium elegans]